jgi:arylsulfatase A-like enzyme
MGSPAMGSEALRAASAGLLLAVLSVLAACGSGAEGRPRNAILISIDTLRPDHLGCYGHERPTSPTLDALAEDGVRFEDVTAAAPWTLPSHATMLTGLYPNHHGVKSHETRLAQEVVTLAEEFEQAGYQTYAVVNTHNMGALQFQLDQGFGEEFRYIIEVEEDRRSMKLKTFNSGDTIVSTAKQFLRGRDPDEPFFLFLHFYDVHTDFTPRAEYRQQLVGPYAGRMTGSTPQLVKFRNAGEQLSEADLRWLREMYDAEIRQLDDLLGRFFGWLDDEGLYDETLFVITSDHGEEFQEHGSLLHGRTQYQEVLGIPLLLSGPGIPAATVISTPVHGVDVTPTILGIMGLDSSMPRDGLDLSPTWSDGALPQRLLYGEADHNNLVAGQMVVDTRKMVREGDSKLLYDTHTERNELYDLAADPGERNDLAALLPERVAELQARLQTFMAGSIEPETVAPPSAEEQRKLDALGY